MFDFLIKHDQSNRINNYINMYISKTIILAIVKQVKTICFMYL